MTETMKTPPAGSEKIGRFCSNFDGVIDDDVAERLKAGGYADYPALGWHGDVWFEEGQYHCLVMRFWKHVATVSAASPVELCEECCERFGYE